MTSFAVLTLIPVVCAAVGALLTAWRRPSASTTSAIQHFAAGVVFAAAAGELLPDLMHRQAPLATVIGGAAGVVVMVGLRALGERFTGRFGLFATIGVDVLVDGLVLGIALAAGQRAGLLLAGALSVEILLLALTAAIALLDLGMSRFKAIGATIGLALLFPVGAAAGIPVAALPGPFVAALFSFGLMALLYLVTEELLVEAHRVPERPWTTAMFFAGFLLTLALEEILATAAPAA